MSLVCHHMILWWCHVHFWQESLHMHLVTRAEVVTLSGMPKQTLITPSSQRGKWQLQAHTVTCTCYTSSWLISLCLLMILYPCPVTLASISCRLWSVCIRVSVIWHISISFSLMWWKKPSSLEFDWFVHLLVAFWWQYDSILLCYI